MSCYIENGFALDCRNASTGGLQTIWILGDSGNTISSWVSNVDNQVTAVTGTGTFYKFELTKQGSSFTEDIGVNTTAQSVVFQPTLVMNLPRMDKDLRNVFQNLVSQNNIFAIAKDNNGRYWTVAWQNGALVTSGSLASGLAYTDLNGMSALTIVGGEPNATQEILVTTTLGAVFTGITVEA